MYPAGSEFLGLDAEIVPALCGSEKVHFNKNVNVWIERIALSFKILSTCEGVNLLTESSILAQD